MIVPVYNKEECVRQCIDSLLAQTMKQMEIILVDDGSRDAGGQICDEYANRFQNIKVLHQANQGLACARNEGLKQADGEYIGFCDADDYVHPRMFEYLVEIMTAENADLGVCGYLRTASRQTELPDPAGFSVKAYTTKDAMKKLIRGEIPFKSYAWNKVYRRSLFNGIIYPPGILYEDQHTTYKLLHAAKKIITTDWPCYCYIDDPASITNRPFRPSELDYTNAWKGIIRFCGENYPELVQDAKDQLVSASVYSYSRLKKSREQFPEEQNNLLCNILDNGKLYRKSTLQTATWKRKLFVECLMMKNRSKIQR